MLESLAVARFADPDHLVMTGPVALSGLAALALAAGLARRSA
jgi:hypothetical protein